MDFFRYYRGRLHCEGLEIDDLAERFGTPLYVYSRDTLESHFRGLASIVRELDPLLCFSVKSLANVHLLRVLGDLGAGMDVVSGGELFRALNAGVPPQRIVYAGVGKSDEEILDALRAGIGCFNVESVAELETLAGLARVASTVADVAVRVNPGIADDCTPKGTATGRRGTKFGIDVDEIGPLFESFRASTAVRLRGLHVHIGSPVLTPAVYTKAVELVADLVDDLKLTGHPIDLVNLGGGFPADYRSEGSVGWSDYAAAIVPALRPLLRSGCRVVMEPGRALSANAGVLVTKVLYVKTGGDRHFTVVDAGMNALIRPALYDAYHFIWPTVVSEADLPQGRGPAAGPAGRTIATDVVGPICESTDALARGRSLPVVRRGDLLCVFAAGAYGMVMASQYNSRPRPAEVLVEGRSARLIRARETYEDLIRLEVGSGAPPSQRMLAHPKRHATDHVQHISS